MRRLLPLALLSAGCTINVINPPPETQDSSVEADDAEAADDEDAGGTEPRDAADGPEDASAPTSDAGSQDARPAETLDASRADATSDAAVETSTRDAAPADAGVCAANTLRKQAPELRIVLDRSGSMRTGVLGLNCKMPPDVLSSQLCLQLGINCSDPFQELRVECGGTQPVIDNWAPAVTALKAYTVEFASSVDFGLTVFPGGTGNNQVCSTGAELAPVGPNNAGPIASALDATHPQGSTPTAATLQGVAAQLEARKAQLGVRLPAQHVLLVTDGAPNCVGTNSATNDPQAHQATIQAIDALTAMGVKTWVAGFGNDPALARQLLEYAMHGGTSSWYAIQGPNVPPSIADATREISACSYALERELATTDVVTLDGQALTRDAPNGFVLRGTSLQLVGGACTTLREKGAQSLSVRSSCAP